HVLRNRDRLRVVDRLDRLTCGGVSVEWQLDRRGRDHRRAHELDRAARVVGLPDVALLAQILEMLVHRRERGVPEVLRDFLEARRIAVLAVELLEKIQDLLLALRQRHGKPLGGAGWAEHLPKEGTRRRTEAQESCLSSTTLSRPSRSPPRGCDWRKSGPGQRMRRRRAISRQRCGAPVWCA